MDERGASPHIIKLSKSEGSRSFFIRALLENNKVTLGISTLSMTISITVLAVTLFKQTPAHAYTVTATPGTPLTFETTCLDCGLFFRESLHNYWGETVLKKLHVTIKDGHRQCCFNNTDQIYMITELLMRNERQELTTESTQKVVPSQIVATHKRLLQPVNKETKYPGEHIYLTHDANNQPKEYTHGVAVTQEGLIVKYSGLYYIYCSIRFHQVRRISETNRYVTFVHRVSPYNPGGTGVLLKSVHTAIHKTTENTFTGGIFFLLKGDRIHVCVTQEEVVDFQSESTFVGMFLLASHQAQDAKLPI